MPHLIRRTAAALLVAALAWAFPVRGDTAGIVIDRSPAIASQYVTHAPHDANLFTFHRIAGFRTLRQESDPKTAQDQ
jgi:hypothetical protein